MAEVMIRTHSHGSGEDGDIICAFNDRRISHVHCSHICNKDAIGFASNGRRASGTLLDHFLKNTYTYKFQRTGEKTLDKILISTGEVTKISDIPNGKEYMDVPAFIRRRLHHDKHQIFGSTGSEFWYGGRTVADVTNLDKVWTAIETMTAKRKADHTQWTPSSGELRGWFWVTVDDGDDNAFSELTQPLLDLTDPDNPITVKKHKHHIDWRALAGMSDATRRLVADRSRTHDSRKNFSYLRGTVLQTKTR